MSTRIEEEFSASMLAVLSKFRLRPDGCEPEVDRTERINVLRADWNAPPLHLGNRTTLDRSGAWQAILDALRAKSGDGYLVALLGLHGRGKTQLAVEHMFHVTERLRSAYYTTAHDLLAHVKSAYAPGSRLTEEQALRRFTKPHLLVIDEVTKIAGSEWSTGTLFSVLDTRYRHHLDTLLVSNATEAAFLDAVGASVASRMSECGGIYELTGPNFRDR